MALATVRSDGYPQATMVNYIHDGLRLYFAADATSQKAGNIKINAKVSVAIAKRVADKQRVEELCLRLFRRLPQSRRFVPEDPKQLATFEIEPIAISVVDYASGFGTSYLLEL